MSRVEEALLVLRAQAGDRQSLAALLEGVQGPLFRCIRSIVDRPQLAEDVLQEVFLIVCRELIWLREPRYFRAWAFRIASREALRRARRERRLLLLDDGGLALVPDPKVPDPVRRELAARLPRLVAEVSPACRPVLALHYLEELSLPAVADVLGLSLGTVKSRLAYGLRQLRRRLGVTAPRGRANANSHRSPK